VPTCDDACFHWLDARAPTLQDPTWERCNPYAVTPGVCPDGFTCVPEQLWDPVHEILKAACVAPPGDLSLELHLASPNPGELDTALKFHDLDGTWTPRPVGTHAVLDALDGSLSVRRTIPDDGIVPLELPRGRYRVRYTPALGTSTTTLLRDGILEINNDGLVHVPTGLRWARIDLVVDGVPCEEGFAFEAYGETGVVRGAAGTDVALWPGSYDLVVTSKGEGSCGLPTVGGRFAAALQVPAEGPVAPPELFTQALGGTLVVDGEPLPGAVVEVRGTGLDGATSATVDADGVWEVLVWQGSRYDLELMSGPGLPEAGTALLGTEVVAEDGAPIALAVGTRWIAGSIAVSGVRPAEGDRGEVRLLAYGSSEPVRLPIHPTGSATFEGRVYDLPSAVTVAGEGQVPTALLARHDLPELRYVLDLPIRVPVSFAATVDGKPVALGSGAGCAFVLSPMEPLLTERFPVDGGELAVDVALTPGSYWVSTSCSGSVPRWTTGERYLGTVDVVVPQAWQFNEASHRVELMLYDHGEPFTGNATLVPGGRLNGGRATLQVLGGAFPSLELHCTDCEIERQLLFDELWF
jgi:hypothetical protein